jgi:osmotically-inducible protein OsmY
VRALAARCRIGPLLAGALGVATYGSSFGVWADDAPLDRDEQTHDEVVVTAERSSDAQVTRRVMAALRQDPYVFADHVTVTTENGVVRLEGVMTDLHDMLRVLRLARRIAGSGRVVNKIELAPSDDDAD